MQIKKNSFSTRHLLHAWAEMNTAGDMEMRVAIETILCVYTRQALGKQRYTMGNVVSIRFCPDEEFIISAIHGYPSGTGQQGYKYGLPS